MAMCPLALLRAVQEGTIWGHLPHHIQTVLTSGLSMGDPSRTLAPLRLRSRFHLVRRLLPREVCHIVQYGFRLPVRKVPPTPSHLREGQVAPELDQVIRDYLTQGVLVPLPDGYSGPLLSHFGVRKRTGGSRLVVNFRPTNLEMPSPATFRLPTHGEVSTSLAEESELSVSDIADAFNLLPLRETSQPLATIAHRFGGADRPTYLRHTTMGFGLSHTPGVWQKVLRGYLHPIKGFLGACHDYVDDLLVVSPKGQGHHQTLLLRAWLTACGIPVNWTKSTVTSATVPTHSVEYLGFRYSSVSLTRELTPQKRAATRAMVLKMLHRGPNSPPQVHDYQRLLGSLNHVSQAVQLSALRLRTLQHTLAGTSEVSLTTRIPISTELRTDLQWWSNELLSPLAQSIAPPDLAVSTHTATVTTDACLGGWGGWLALPGSTEPVETSQGFWTARLRSTHITELELRTAVKCLHMWVLRYPQVRYWTLRVDNSTAAWYLRGLRGGRMPHLSRLVVPLHDAMRQRGMDLHVQWISTHVNTLADQLSRLPQDRSDVRLKQVYLRRGYHELQLPLPTLDLMATRANRRAPQWISRNLELGATWVDVFTCPVEVVRGHSCWANPPWELIPRFLRWVEQVRPTLLREPASSLVVLTPDWKYSSWHPRLQRLSLAQAQCPKDTSIFVDCYGRTLRHPPRWPTCFWRLW